VLLETTQDGHQSSRLQAALPLQLTVAHKRILAKYQVHETLSAFIASRRRLKRKTTFVTRSSNIIASPAAFTFCQGFTPVSWPAASEKGSACGVSNTLYLPILHIFCLTASSAWLCTKCGGRQAQKCNEMLRWPHPSTHPGATRQLQPHGMLRM
jgi:hypothetical protein